MIFVKLSVISAGCLIDWVSSLFSFWVGLIVFKPNPSIQNFRVDLAWGQCPGWARFRLEKVTDHSKLFSSTIIFWVSPRKFSRIPSQLNLIFFSRQLPRRAIPWRELKIMFVLFFPHFYFDNLEKYSYLFNLSGFSVCYQNLCKLNHVCYDF